MTHEYITAYPTNLSETTQQLLNQLLQEMPGYREALQRLTTTTEWEKQHQPTDPWPPLQEELTHYAASGKPLTPQHLTRIADTRNYHDNHNHISAKLGKLKAEARGELNDLWRYRKHELRQPLEHEYNNIIEQLTHNLDAYETVAAANAETIIHATPKNLTTWRTLHTLTDKYNAIHTINAYLNDTTQQRAHARKNYKHIGYNRDAFDTLTHWRDARAKAANIINNTLDTQPRARNWCTWLTPPTLTPTADPTCPEAILNTIRNETHWLPTADQTTTALQTAVTMVQPIITGGETTVPAYELDQREHARTRHYDIVNIPAAKPFTPTTEAPTKVRYQRISFG